MTFNKHNIFKAFIELLSIWIKFLVNIDVLYFFMIN